MIDLIKITEDQYDEMPFIVEKDMDYFLIVKNYAEVGIYTIKKIKDRVCEIGWAIFKKYRHKVLSRQAICFLIDFPFLLGFSKVIGWTKIDTFIKLLKRFEYFGIFLINSPNYDHDSFKIWFQKEVGFTHGNVIKE